MGLTRQRTAYPMAAGRTHFTDTWASGQMLEGLDSCDCEYCGRIDSCQRFPGQADEGFDA